MGLSNWILHGSWKDSEKLIQSLDCRKQIVRRNMDVENTPGKSSEGSEKHNRQSVSHLREYICHHKQKAGKKQTLKVILVRAQKKMRNIIKNQRKNNPFQTVAKKKKQLM